MNPSTASLARICKLLIRMSVGGSMSGADGPAGLALVVLVPDRGRSRGGMPSDLRALDVVQNAVDHGIDAHAVGLSAITEQDPVAHRGMNECANVVRGDVEPPREQCAGF